MKSPVKMYMLMIAMILGLNGLMPKIAHADPNEKIQKIEQFVEDQRKISKIPGISVVIVEKGETVYQNGFGYADVQKKAPVTSNTLFEIASVTKAFTALAILQLEKEGLLNQYDDVRKYIPWLELKYKGEIQTITINQLLHHTSGIASNSMVNIPESNAENAIELTVKTLINKELNRKPGSSFEYATINYDILGLILEKVTKQPYEMYIKQQILEPIGMNESFVGLHQVNSDELATGYKIGFMSAQKYIPPFYRGNGPAGYIISNSDDIAKWMMLQLGSNQSNIIGKEIIQQSHVPDQSVKPFDQNTYYASGWGIMNKGDQQNILHAGENPTFSSYIVMQPEEKLGVAILSNMKSTFTTAIGQGVIDLWQGNNVNIQHTDSYQKMDQILTIVCIVVFSLGVVFILFSLRLLMKINKKQRIWTSLNLKRIVFLIVHTVFVGGILIFTALLPKNLLGGLNWEFIKVWGPTSVSVFFYSVISVSVIYYLFGLVLIMTKKEKLNLR